MTERNQVVRLPPMTNRSVRSLTHWRRVRPLLAAVVLAAAACADDGPTTPAEAVAYDPTALTGFSYHWGPGRTISIYIDPTAAPPGTDLAASVGRAITAWERTTRDVRLRTVAALRDADVVIHHVTAPRLMQTGGCSPFDVGAGGYTFFCLDGDTPEILPLLNGSGGRVKMDVTVDRSAAADAATFDAIVAHELGHVLGIGAHSPLADDLMFGAPRRPDPSERDARTLRVLLRVAPEVAF